MLRNVDAGLRQLRALIVAIADHHTQGNPALAASTRDNPAPQGRDGARYPPESDWCAAGMPDRRTSDGVRDKTTGHVHHDDWPAIGDRRDTPVVSGYHPRWSAVAEQGLIEVGLRKRNARFLSAHVEIQVAAMMIATGRREVELTINHRPCPDNAPYLGCGSALPRYLPTGYTLTIYGTTIDGQPTVLRAQGQR